MPSCRSCNPTCQRCHKKPNFYLPQKCPVCGRYNPNHWTTCPKCGNAIEPFDPQKARAYLSTETKKSCFQCDPLTKPLCGTCLKTGRIKKCPECGKYVLGTRKDCKHCGHIM